MHKNLKIKSLISLVQKVNLVIKNILDIININTLEL